MYDFDIDLYFSQFHYQIYADDTIAIADFQSQLQTALDAAHAYCENKCLTVKGILLVLK